MFHNYIVLTLVIEFADIVKFKSNRIVLVNSLGQNIPFSVTQTDKMIYIRLKNNAPPGWLIMTLEFNDQTINDKVFVY
jgi:hypothetical protein